MFANRMYLIYMYKQNLSLNNPQWLINRKTRPNQVVLNFNTIKLNSRDRTKVVISDKIWIFIHYLWKLVWKEQTLII